jgi:cytochrome c oxidase subunit 3
MNTAAHQPQFVSVAQQRSAAKLGMWAFVAQEVLFFSGLLLTYAAMRAAYPETFALAHERLDMWLGTLNTAVLLVSSFTMALAVRAAKLGERRHVVLALALTALLGCAFLAIKGYEYATDWSEGLLPGRWYAGHGIAGRPDIFFGLYFALTGLHGVHVAIGILGLLSLSFAVVRSTNPLGLRNTIEGFGLYWHFVDIVWIFLYPLLYLIR